MRANTSPKSSGRTVIWVLLAIAIFAGTGIPIYRAASQSSISTSNTSTNLDISSILGMYSTLIPSNVLQLLQIQANSPPWNQDTSSKTQAILQRCAALQQLLASGPTDDTLSNALAASTLRASIFIAFGESLYDAGDTHHAEMYFNSVVTDHPSHATAKHLARCHLWLGKLYQDDALAAKYQQAAPDQASTLFQTATANYLAAKDASADWVRGSGWLGAAACYRQLGDQEARRICLQSLLNELAAAQQTTSTQSTTNGLNHDATLEAVQRDVATYLLATSFYEDGRYPEAAQVYQQMLGRINAQLSTNSAEYTGQSTYLDMANVGLRWCTERQAAQGTVNLSQTEGQPVP
jgi:TolA-binding protein